MVLEKARRLPARTFRGGHGCIRRRWKLMHELGLLEKIPAAPRTRKGPRNWRRALATTCCALPDFFPACPPRLPPTSPSCRNGTSSIFIAEEGRRLSPASICICKSEGDRALIREEGARGPGVSARMPQGGGGESAPTWWWARRRPALRWLRTAGGLRGAGHRRADGRGSGWASGKLAQRTPGQVDGQYRAPGRIFNHARSRADYWQCAYVIPKGGHRGKCRRAGLPAFPAEASWNFAPATWGARGPRRSADWDQVQAC